MEVVAIRPVEPDDHDAVRRLTRRLLVGVDPSRPRDLVWNAVEGWISESLAEAGADDRASWGAMVDGIVVGYVSVAEEDHWCGQTDAWLGELVVDERHEGRGIARTMVATVESWARERGLEHVRLSTGAANSGAQAFYARLGYALSDVTLTRRIGPVPE